MRTFLLGCALIFILSSLNEVEDHAQRWAISHGYAYLWRGK